MESSTKARTRANPHKNAPFRRLATSAAIVSAPGTTFKVPSSDDETESDTEETLAERLKRKGKRKHHSDSDPDDDIPLSVRLRQPEEPEQKSKSNPKPTAKERAEAKRSTLLLASSGQRSDEKTYVVEEPKPGDIVEMIVKSPSGNASVPKGPVLYVGNMNLEVGKKGDIYKRSDVVHLKIVGHDSEVANRPAKKKQKVEKTDEKNGYANITTDKSTYRLRKGDVVKIALKDGSATFAGTILDVSSTMVEISSDSNASGKNVIYSREIGSVEVEKQNPSSSVSTSSLSSTVSARSKRLLRISELQEKLDSLSASEPIELDEKDLYLKGDVLKQSKRDGPPTMKKPELVGFLCTWMDPLQLVKAVVKHGSSKGKPKWHTRGLSERIKEGKGYAADEIKGNKATYRPYEYTSGCPRDLMAIKFPDLKSLYARLWRTMKSTLRSDIKELRDLTATEEKHRKGEEELEMKKQVAEQQAKTALAKATLIKVLNAQPNVNKRMTVKTSYATDIYPHGDYMMADSMREADLVMEATKFLSDGSLEVQFVNDFVMATYWGTKTILSGTRVQLQMTDRANFPFGLDRTSKEGAALSAYSPAWGTQIESPGDRHLAIDFFGWRTVFSDLNTQYAEEYAQAAVPEPKAISSSSSSSSSSAADRFGGGFSSRRSDALLGGKVQRMVHNSEMTNLASSSCSDSDDEGSDCKRPLLATSKNSKWKYGSLTACETKPTVTKSTTSTTSTTSTASTTSTPLDILTGAKIQFVTGDRVSLQPKANSAKMTTTLSVSSWLKFLISGAKADSAAPLRAVVSDCFKSQSATELYDFWTKTVGQCNNPQLNEVAREIVNSAEKPLIKVSALVALVKIMETNRETLCLVV